MSELESLIDAAKQGNLNQVKAILRSHPDLINQHDPTGATALHYAAFAGQRSVVRQLIEQGAEVNSRDRQFGATPTGWAIEYLREMGGFLSIELEDLAHAIRRGEVDWVARFLRRFPTLRGASDPQGTPFKLLAQQSGNREIANLFGLTAG